MTKFYTCLTFYAFVSTLILSVSLEFCDEQGCGGIVDSDTTLRYVDSPFQITRDTLVLKDATLKIEPGVRLQFDPQVLLAVNGTLDARVSECGKAI